MVCGRWLWSLNSCVVVVVGGCVVVVGGCVVVVVGGVEVVVVGGCVVVSFAPPQAANRSAENSSSTTSQAYLFITYLQYPR